MLAGRSMTERIKRTKVPEPLASILVAYFNVDGYGANWLSSLQRVLGRSDPKSREREQQFRRQLADAVLRRSLTKEDYEILTDEDFDTQDDLQRRLEDVWKELYGDADPRSEA